METEIIAIEKSQLEGLLAKAVNERQKTFWTASEISEETSLSLRTIGRYTKQGIFQKYDLGTPDVKAVRYKLTEVLAAWQKVNYT